MSTSIEYAGIFLNKQEGKQDFIKLCDTAVFQKPSVDFQDKQVKSTLKALLKTMENDDSQKKTYNFTHSFFVYFNSNVYFVILGRSELSEDKLFNFYLDLKKDLLSICRNKLSSL